MGWCSGSELAEEVWVLVKKYIDPKDYKHVSHCMLSLFENHDADAFDNEMEIIKDSGLAKKWEEEEDDEE